MKLILVLLGILLGGWRVFYRARGSIAHFHAGSRGRLTRVHSKHGIVAAIAGLVLIAADMDGTQVSNGGRGNPRFAVAYLDTIDARRNSQRGPPARHAPK